MNFVVLKAVHREKSCRYGFFLAKSLFYRNRRLPLSTTFKLFTKGNVACQKNYNGDVVKQGRSLPKLIYIQNPVTWLINKIDFKMLRSAWDPDFDEEEFKRGTKQAVAVICTLISKDMWDNLRGLVTRQALIRLRRDVEVNWSDEQRRNIYMDASDIKLALPRKIHFLKIADQKFVDVDMMCVAMKFKNREVPTENDFVLVELVARFHRNYTIGQIPNWTVTLFKVTRFNIKPEK